MSLISIIVDGFPDQVPEGATLDELIERHQAQHKDLIVELDGRFVYPRDYAATRLAPGSRVEFIHPAFGG
ncbi:MAG: sulfur carrier protein ThiS [Thermodesulfobacteriota bacterium]